MTGTTSLADMFDATKWGEDFSRDEVERIARHLSLETYKAGEYIFHENDRQSYMAFIVEGMVDIKKEGDEALEESIISLRPRTHFGEMAFVDGEPRSASAVAREDATLLILSEKNFENILKDEPAIGVKMLRKIASLLSRRLRQTTGRLVCMKI